MENPEPDAEDILVNITGSQTGLDEVETKFRKKLKQESVRRKKRESRGLTQRIVDRAKPKDKEYRILDNLKTFGLRVRPSGHKTFELIYKAHGNKFRRYKIGNADTMTLEEAYAKALDLRGEIYEGHDPQSERKLRQDFTLDDFFHSYVKDRVRPDLSRSWGKETERIFLRYVQATLGTRPVSAHEGHRSRKDVYRLPLSGTRMNQMPSDPPNTASV